MEQKKRKKNNPNRKYIYRKKHGKMIPYIPKRGRDDPVMLWAWREEPMPYSSIRRIPKKLRPTARKIIYKKDKRFDVAPKEITNKEDFEKICNLALDEVGNYLIMMFCHAKNKFGVSPKKVASIVIRDTPTGKEAVLVKNWRLYRYWFWKGGSR